MKLSRRTFNMGLAGLAGATVIGRAGGAFAARDNELNILCWEGYNTDNVLEPFRELRAGKLSDSLDQCGLLRRHG